VSTELHETPSGLTVTRFGCGECHAACIQLTTSTGYVVVHASEAEGVARAFKSLASGRARAIARPSVKAVRP